MKMKETQTKRTMDGFVLALVPGSLVMMYIFGLGILINILTAVVTVVLCEYLSLKARGMAISTNLDGSALATGLLWPNFTTLAPHLDGYTGSYLYNSYC